MRAPKRNLDSDGKGIAARMPSGGERCRLSPLLKPGGRSLYGETYRQPWDREAPEIELLLCCARTHADDRTVARLKTLQQQSIDWDHLIQLAGHHRIIPLLYQTLKQWAPSAVPQAILNQLRKQVQAQAVYNSLLAQELRRLLDQFAAHAIPAIPFKGPGLAAALYGNLALRQFIDLDILIGKQDIPKARNLLILEGYQPSTNYGWQQEFLQPQRGITVDLHWELTPSSYFPFTLDEFEQLWQRACTISLQGQSIPSFSADDLLLILALQIARSGVEGKELLAQVCDLAEFLRVHPLVDCQKLMLQASALNIERPLWISLCLVEELLQAQLPNSLRQFLQQSRQRDPVIQLYAERMGKRLISMSESEDPFVVQEFVKYLMAAKPFARLPRSIYLVWQFLDFAISRIFISTQADRDFLPLPSLLSPLYCLIRPVRLIGKFGIKKIGKVAQT